MTNVLLSVVLFQALEYLCVPLPHWINTQKNLSVLGHENTGGYWFSGSSTAEAAPKPEDMQRAKHRIHDSKYKLLGSQRWPETDRAFLSFSVNFGLACNSHTHELSPRKWQLKPPFGTTGQGRHGPLIVGRKELSGPALRINLLST